jgi:AcrR family transcriptional regulator
MNDAKRQRIISVAHDVFAKYGYRRVNMKEIAAAAGVSRPGLYLYFRTKEEIFSAAVVRLADGAIARIRQGLGERRSTEDQLLFAFEVWTVEIFDLTVKSLEARELSECSFEFAREALDEGYRHFEAILTSILKAHAKSSGAKLPLSADRMAHLLASSVRGFKAVAHNSAELPRMIHDLLKVTVPG